MKNNCPFCSSKKQKDLGKYRGKLKSDYPEKLLSKTARVFECKNCGLAYVSPLPSKSKLEKHYKSYQYWKIKRVKKLSYNSKEWGKLFSKVPILNYGMWRAIRCFHYLKKANILTKGIKVLDIGCGFAPFLFACNENGIKSINSVESSLKIGKFLAKNKINNFFGSIEDFLERNNPQKYDLIILSHVIEHLRNPLTVLEKTKKYLADEGMLYIEVPYRNDKNSPIIEGHLFFFEKNSLELILSKKGYKIHQYKYFWSPRQIHIKLKQEVSRQLNLTEEDRENDCLIFRKERSSFKRVERNDWKNYIKPKTNKELLIALSTDDLGIVCSLK